MSHLPEIVSLELYKNENRSDIITYCIHLDNELEIEVDAHYYNYDEHLGLYVFFKEESRKEDVEVLAISPKHLIYIDIVKE